jgi:hypothetical protein
MWANSVFGDTKLRNSIARLGGQIDQFWSFGVVFMFLSTKPYMIGALLVQRVTYERQVK